MSAVVALVLGFRAGPPGRRSGVLLLAVVVVLSAGIVGSRATGSAPLDLRWSRSVTAFDAEVAVLGPPPPISTSGGERYSATLPLDCPVQIGSMIISACKAFEGGYMFTQAMGALTDDSGIVYLPYGNNPERTGYNASELTALGGPIWSWTCGC